MRLFAGLGTAGSVRRRDLFGARRFQGAERLESLHDGIRPRPSTGRLVRVTACRGKIAVPAVVSRKDGEASFLDPFLNALQGLLDPQARLAVPAGSLQRLLLNRHVGPLRAQKIKGGGVGFRDD